MTTVKKSALESQEGGTHYKDMKIQPVEFIHANNLGFCEATAIKYLCRWRKKGGIQDLKKAIHFIEVLIELESSKSPIPINPLHINPSYQVKEGPYCSHCGQNLADFRHDQGKYLAPVYWCSDCACVEGIDTTNMTLMGRL